ncbi:helix-turn-helix domain-containing protein [Acidiferrimicrobium sp. IK]|uniref:helix-turn-helix domain-containing protein n=1 Tax=Acidiferrimicrobium sp. IK TaxID=2871700 RepID=UPI0021CB3538|nr:helix-turn-helix domain-containing protein [Acidiferrimicrobium sp. IK]MCU4183551.1 helix-turn-helix domain-containing protein [Acidiferrimicrobium sp. IK]
MHDDNQEAQRKALLANLFGSEVPSGLGGQLLRTADVAALFQVSERTVSEWARRGRIPSVRTPGGHRRYPAEEMRQLLAATEDAAVTERRMAAISPLRSRPASA